jgi:hypothetical protein
VAPEGAADRLGDFMGVAEYALVHDGDLYPSPPGPLWINLQQRA